MVQADFENGEACRKIHIRLSSSSFHDGQMYSDHFQMRILKVCRAMIPLVEIPLHIVWWELWQALISGKVNRVSSDLA